MAKNTGRGSSGTMKIQSNPPWIHRYSTAGRFLKAKEKGGSFGRIPMPKKFRQKLYGISYRLRMKTIHKLGLCQPEVNAFLAEKHELLKTHWVVPYRCDWCGASNRRVVSPSEYQVLQSRSWKRQQKISRLFGD